MNERERERSMEARADHEAELRARLRVLDEIRERAEQNGLNSYRAYYEAYRQLWAETLAALGHKEDGL